LKYWDSSALVALCVEQRATGQVRKLYADDSKVLSWTLSDVEIASAFCRLAREDALGREDLIEAFSQLEIVWKALTTVSVLESVKTRARRLLRTHPLCAAGALQLGAALVAAYDEPPALDFVCLDDRLGDAASKEGFKVLP
jgi:hypothetical protein